MLINIQRMSNTYDPGWNSFVSQLFDLIKNNKSGNNSNSGKIIEPPITTIDDVFRKFMHPRLLWNSRLIKNSKCKCKIIVLGTGKNSWIIDFGTNEIKQEDGIATFTVKILAEDLINVVNHKVSIEFLLANRRITIGGDTRNLFALIKLLQEII